ncbi:MAG: HypC/HybG/HupF family hydrogenase formation chaperone [Candidatus Micrarchaeota archaeon]
MCLALPAQVIRENGFSVIVRIGKTKRTVLNATQAIQGEWVLVENGVATEKLDQEESQLMAKAWNETKKKKKKR